MWLSRYILLFMIYSFLGWIYETAFCTIRRGKWENRGFLYGPICPIYGTGALIISLIMNETAKRGLDVKAWQVFLISVFGSAVLEYATSWVLEKLFHAAWWDYSNFPFNIKGRISLFTSLGFGAGGLLIVYVIAPFTENFVNCITPVWTEFIALCLVFIFAVDLTLTVTALKHFDRVVIYFEKTFNQSMETIVNSTFTQSSRIKDSIIKKSHSLNEQLSGLSGLAKSAVRRVYSFKERDENINTIKNQILSKIRGAAGRNRHTEDENDSEPDNDSKQ